MNEQNKTKDELIYETLMLRKRVDELRAADSECKRVENALRESEKRYRMLAETAHDFIFIIDSRGHVSYVNNFSAQEFGCKPEDIIGKSIVDIFPPETVEAQEKSLTEVFETGQSLHREGVSRFPTRDVWLNTWLVPLKDSSGAVQSVIGISRDVSSQKKAEKDLQENERFLSNIFSSIKDGICVLDKDMNIVRVNPIMEEWYKYEMPIVGKKCYEVYHGRSQRCDICPSHQTLQTSKPAYEVVSRGGEDGKVAGYQDLYSFPMIDEATGEIKGVIEYVRDITDRTRIEEQLSYRTKFEKLITTISTNFINLPPDKIDEGLNYALEALGQFVGVDRSYIFLLYDGGTKMTNTHEWCAEGIKSHIGSLQGLIFDS
ncbi:MAG: PAS domain-containing protein, partial [Candidatus Omnitrophota bacterium]